MNHKMNVDNGLEFLSCVDGIANSSQCDSATEEIVMEYKQEVPPFPWTELPPLVVERIYSFLNRQDQSYMSQVCKNWSKEYSSPCLWREITFNLPEQALSTCIHPAVRSAQRYGHFFHHVRIVCRRFRPPLLEIIHRQLKLFLQFLEQHSQLLSISFKNISAYVWHLHEGDIGEFRQNVIDLLLSQHNLLSVEFENSQFKKDVATEISQAIFSSSFRTLKKLKLVGFMDRISDETSNDITTDVPLTLETLMNLKILTINYSHYFENIITSIYEYGSGMQLRERGVLKTISLFCDGSEIFNYNGIKPEVWKYFSELFPALKMLVFIDVGNQERDQFDVFIVRHMPVSSLFLKWDANRSELGSVLRSVTECEINKNLKLLHVAGLKNTSNLAQDLIRFLQISPKLLKLQLDVQSQVNDLNAVFEYWLEVGPMFLETVHIIIRNISDSTATSHYINLADNYGPLLQVIGLNLILIVESE